MFPPQCGAPPPQAAATTPQAPLPQQATDQLQLINYNKVSIILELKTWRR